MWIVILTVIVGRNYCRPSYYSNEKCEESHPNENHVFDLVNFILMYYDPYHEFCSPPMAMNRHIDTERQEIAGKMTGKGRQNHDGLIYLHRDFFLSIKIKSV